MKLWMVAAPILLLALSGCRARVIQVHLTNTSPQPVSGVIVDYPSATFGRNSLAPGESFKYAIKPTENGPVKVQFIDAHGMNHSLSGPVVQKGQEGSIGIKISQDSASMETELH